MEAQMLLRDPEVFPSEEILSKELDVRVYSTLASFTSTITSPEYGLETEWRYYNDGKAWLCKVTHKKKTILWLSIWEGFFKVSFYFTEKHLEAIDTLEISETIKQAFMQTKPIGRLIPMIFDITDNEQLQDLLTVVRFKKNLK
ncbi:DUF3788 family protein [Bacteroides reticulotermitis]|uniref:OrfG protein n=2 Tax=Bacteroides reticulotermitis TaxID=1133319 RepID=W4UVW3_9BACE|nr:DUF3788 family protein [Bacteroides reticulotermitis]MBB4044754.1 hypothetical protein [Bacteroides reticulotermitis]GAE84743.1 OrfG protein [Bacteroides reticulotermitis JCM 10512]